MMKTTKAKIASIAGAIILTIIGINSLKEDNEELDDKSAGKRYECCEPKWRYSDHIGLDSHLSQGKENFYEYRLDFEMKELEKKVEEDYKRYEERAEVKREEERQRILREKAIKRHQEALERQKRIEESARLLEEKKKEEERKKTISRSSEYMGVNKDMGTFNVSWYGADCRGCTGKTATGINVRNTIKHNGYGVAASDWTILPPYSIIEVEGYGRYIVLDKGGAIKGSKLDLLTTSEAKSNEYGRQHLNVKVLRWGKK